MSRIGASRWFEHLSRRNHEIGVEGLTRVVLSPSYHPVDWLGRARTGRWNRSTTRSDLLGEQTSGPLESQVSTGLQTENPENAHGKLMHLERL
jgi:hypothetical protein